MRFRLRYPTSLPVPVLESIPPPPRQLKRVTAPITHSSQCLHCFSSWTDFVLVSVSITFPEAPYQQHTSATILSRTHTIHPTRAHILFIPSTKPRNNCEAFGFILQNICELCTHVQHDLVISSSYYRLSLNLCSLLKYSLYYSHLALSETWSFI